VVTKALRVVVTALSFGLSSPEPRVMLESRGIEIVPNVKGKPFTEEEMMSLIDERVVGLIVGTDPVTRYVMERGANLKVVAKHGVGIDNIDVRAATERGIYVTTTPGANTEAVADLAFALMLSAVRRVAPADAAVRQGKWPRLLGTEVAGKALGILGLGRVGKAVANRARGFSMRVLAHDVVIDEQFCRKNGITPVGFEELLEESDIVTLHTPLTPGTRGMIGESAISRMKDGVVLVNTARGELVDLDALYKALLAGKVAAAGIDVYPKEPPDIAHPIFALENVVFTPHLGAYTREANYLMGVMAARSVIDAVEGRRPEYAVNDF
jgi:D-3-phosphoglycerate dehydrogenase